MSHILTQYFEVVQAISLNYRVRIRKTKDKKVNKIIIKNENICDRGFVLNKYILYGEVVCDIPHLHKV